ncbi:MAG: rhomboid family intramembrane serine protease [Polyangiaceae bacterium]
MSRALAKSSAAGSSLPARGGAGGGLAFRELKRELFTQAAIRGGGLALLWVLEIVDQLFLHGSLDQLGIRPRTLTGLRGILLAPLLHGGFAHLVSNSVPLLVLGWMVMLRETRHIFPVTALATLVGGLGVWLVGAPGSVHIGASIVVFGYLGYLLLRGWFERSLWSIVGSLFVAVLYGGLVLGVLPGQAGVSWEGHLFGFLGGVLAARLMRKKRS